MNNKTKTIKIAGAGIAGLTSAIVLAKSGYNVRVFERSNDVGHRFCGDLEGLTNWGFDENILDFMKNIGLEINFWNKLMKNLTLFNSRAIKTELFTENPFVYLVMRGNQKGTLDYALKEQAIKNEVEIVFNSPVSSDNVDIIATGPKFDGVTDAMASGYTFRSDSKDTFAAALNSKLAFKGYSYLLIADGVGTVASCIFGDYRNLPMYLDKTLSFFKKNVSFDMKDEKKFAGFGSFHLLNSERRYVGEAGGFQDFLWGFGMRYAMITGNLAAKSIIENCDYRDLWEKELSGMSKASIMNRLWFSMLNDHLRDYFIKSSHRRKNLLKFVTKMYRKNVFSRLLYPIARVYFNKNIKDRLSAD